MEQTKEASGITAEIMAGLPKLPEGYEWKLKTETMDRAEYLALVCGGSELGYLLHRKDFDLPWDIVLESADQFYGSRKTLDEAARVLVRVAFPAAAEGLVSQVSTLDEALERIRITAKWGVVDPSSAREQLETIAELAQLAINRQPLPAYEGDGEPDKSPDISPDTSSANPGSGTPKGSWIDNLPPGCEPEDFEVKP